MSDKISLLDGTDVGKDTSYTSSIPLTKEEKKREIALHVLAWFFLCLFIVSVVLQSIMTKKIGEITSNLERFAPPSDFDSNCFKAIQDKDGKKILLVNAVINALVDDRNDYSEYDFLPGESNIANILVTPANGRLSVNGEKVFDPEIENSILVDGDVKVNSPGRLQYPYYTQTVRYENDRDIISRTQFGEPCSLDYDREGTAHMNLIFRRPCSDSTSNQGFCKEPQSYKNDVGIGFFPQFQYAGQYIGNCSNIYGSMTLSFCPSKELHKYMGCSFTPDSNGDPQCIKKFNISESIFDFNF